MTNATWANTDQGETQVVLETHNSRGAGACKRRWIRSVGSTAAGCDFVVDTVFDRFTCRTPATFINLAV